MKKYYFFMALATTALMTACSTENEFTPQGSGEEVNFFVDNGPITRTTVDTQTAATTFEAGDEIGITATGGAMSTNAHYKVGDGSDGALTVADGLPITWEATGAGNFYAYYPYASDAVTDGKVSFTVTNQDTEANFNANDFLVAKKENVANKGNITFSFAHGLSLVQVATAETATDVTIAAKPTVEWTYADGTFTTSGTETEIKMWKISEGNFWAMVPAQTITAGTEFIKITSEGKNYIYKPTGEIALSTAKSKKFTLTLGESGQAVSIATDLDTEGWTEDTGVTSGTEEENVPPVELISVPDGTFTAETVFNPVTQKQDCVIGWNKFMADANGKIEVEDGALHIVAPTGSWHNATAYYCAEGATASTYELTFKGKTDAVATDDQDIQISIIACSSANDYFVRVGSGSSYVYQKLGAEYNTTEYKFKFDLSQIRRTSHNAEAVDASDTDREKVLIFFTPKTKKGENFYIKDVTLKEVKE